MNNNPNNWYKASTSFYLTKLEYPYQDFKVVSDELVQLLKANGSVSRVRDDTKRAIKLLSLNLYLRHHQFGEKGIVNVYKKEKIFKKGNVYQDVFGLAFKSFNAVLKGLEELALIKMKLGGIDSKEGKQIRRPTKICATDKFFKLLDAHLDIDTIVVPVEAMIQLKTDKDEIKRYYLEYKRLPTKDKKLTNQIRLKKFNELSQNTIISVGDHTFSKADVLFKRVYRNDFKKNGRLHCHPLQNLSKDLRPYLRFNNEPTVEVDIVSSHLLLAYALGGKDLTTLPPAYELDNIECDKNGTDEARLNRKILKQCLLMLLNTSTVHGCAEGLLNWRVGEEEKLDSCIDDSAITEIAKTLPLFDLTAYRKTTSESFECKVIAQSMYDKHKLHIKGWLDGKNVGVKLMYVESEILFDVVGHFTSKGIYCLPIHDSIRIAESHKDELYDVMLSTIQKHLDIEFDDVSKVLEVEGVKAVNPSEIDEINKKVMLTYENT
tara:strand:- start:21627 stop:23096 length:1470 start_codon:yes stop_codon:yes gene_type:complete